MDGLEQYSYSESPPHLEIPTICTRLRFVFEAKNFRTQPNLLKRVLL